MNIGKLESIMEQTQKNTEILYEAAEKVFNAQREVAKAFHQHREQGMTLNEYQELSKRTMPSIVTDPDYSKEKAISNYAMGLAGEAGEVVDAIKKELFHGHEHDTTRQIVKKELGDALHYLSGLATLYGFTLEEIAKANINKLKERYPDGFDPERSRNRKEYQEEPPIKNLGTIEVDRM